LINALVGPPVPTITTGSSLASGAVNMPYTQTLAATGGTSPYTWFLFSGSLPSGLNLSSTGTISGTPAAAGTANFTLQVRNSQGISSIGTFSLEIYPEGTPIITTSSPLPSGAQGSAYNETLTASGGTPPYSWSVSSGTLTPGLSLSAGGVISGTSTAAGNTSFTVQVADSNQLSSADSFSLTIVPLPPVITSAVASTGTYGYAFSYQITATNNPTSYLASGLPTGLFVYSAGLISGTPTATGTFTGTISATNAGGTGSATLTIVVLQPPSITSGPPPAGTVGVAYNFTYVASGYPAPVFSQSGGSFPGGLTLSPTGSLTGTPTTPGTFTGTVTASNGVGTAASQPFSITIYNTYSSWAASNGLTGNNALQTAVLEPDGLNNLYKYALGLNPFQIYNPGSAGLPVVQIVNVSGTDYLEFSFDGVATDVTYTVQATNNLTGTWTTVATFPSGGGPPPGQQTVQDTQPITASSQRLMRLYMTNP
jgi:hypothetical protein